MVKDLYRFKPIKIFYNVDLNISDDELSIIKWFDIISKFKEKFIDNDINIYYINNKITNINKQLNLLYIRYIHIKTTNRFIIPFNLYLSVTFTCCDSKLRIIVLI